TGCAVLLLTDTFSNSDFSAELKVLGLCSQIEVLMLDNWVNAINFWAKAVIEIFLNYITP
ncbi:44618_t:CDS:1, partial [Gigaspora margarita]